MTNPNNAIGTNGAYGGRTSVNAFNDNLAIYLGRGVLSGFVVSPDSGMSVVIGGDGTTRDVAIAEDNIGNKTTINNISESPVALTIAGAPASNSRIDAIVAYVDNPAQGSATETDNPSACGLIAVQGTVAATPSQPDENAIRTAITADGASGSTAYYVVLGYITVENGTTDITSEMIAQGGIVKFDGGMIADGTFSGNSFDSATLKVIAYMPGDTITSPNYETYQGFGRGANSKTRAQLFFTLSKPIIGVSSITISWGQYALQFFDIESGTKVFADPGSATATQFTANGFQFMVDFPTAFTTGGNYEYGFFSLGTPTITFN